MKKGWKVIQGTDRTSVLTSIKYGGVNYPLNVRAKPQRDCGPLAVFITLEQAERFKKSICNRGDEIIVKCSYKRSKEYALWDKDGNAITRGYLPIGTDFASEVTCLE